MLQSRCFGEQEYDLFVVFNFYWMFFGYVSFFFFFNDPAPPEIYPFSLHAPLPIFGCVVVRESTQVLNPPAGVGIFTFAITRSTNPNSGANRVSSASSRSSLRSRSAVCRRSEEHTSELQSQSNLVCRLLLEKKKSTK